MKSDLLLELLQEVEGNSPEMVTFTVNPMQRALKLFCVGISGKMQVKVPESCTIVEDFVVGDKECKASYNLSVLKHFFKTMQMCKTMLLKMTEDGILTVSFLVQSNTDSYIEFNVS